MNWRQKKCIRINEAKVIATLFEIGTNWNARKERLATCNNEKAMKLYQELDKRIDRIVEIVRQGDVVSFPSWYFDKIFKPFTDSIKAYHKEQI